MSLGSRSLVRVVLQRGHVLNMEFSKQKGSCSLEITLYIDGLMKIMEAQNRNHPMNKRGQNRDKKKQVINKEKRKIKKFKARFVKLEQSISGQECTKQPKQ